MASASKKPGLRRHSSSRRIIVVAVPPVDELDLVGPLQVFNSVNRLAGRPIYAIEVVTNSDRPTVEGEGGVLTFVARHHFKKIEGMCDSVLLACGTSSRSVRDPALTAWLKKMAPEVRRLGAVCVGAFLLAEAGLLDGRRATTHTHRLELFAREFPSVTVEEGKIIDQGDVVTAGGVSSGIDLALYLVERWFGAEARRLEARRLDGPW